MIETAQQQRQTAAAVESFRNEVVGANRSTPRLGSDAAQEQKGYQNEVDDHTGGQSRRERRDQLSGP